MNINVLKKLASINSDNVHLNKDKIINGHERDVLVYYIPDEQLFEKDFGVENLSQFINYVSYFKNPTLVFGSGNIITIKDEEAKSFVKYKECAATIMEPVLEENKLREAVLEKTRRLAKEGNCTKIDLSNKEISAIIKACRDIGSFEDTTLKIEKKGENVLFNVVSEKNKQASFGALKNVSLKRNSTDFSHEIFIDRLLVSDGGTWELFIFEDDIGIDVDFNNVYCYMRNIEDHLELIVAYKKDI